MNIISKFFVVFFGISLAPVALAGGNERARRFNVSLNPLSLISGALSTGFEWRAADHLTMGPYLHYDASGSGDNQTSNIGLGFRTDYAFSGVFNDGWYVSPFISRYSFKGHNASTDTTNGANTTIASQYEYDALNIGAVAGYGWYWSSGFNLRLGAGLMHTTLSGDFSISDDSSSGANPIIGSNDSPASGLLPTGELIFAWAF